MIELIPAIDIIDGKCVRLSQGDYDSKKVYNENPVEVALELEAHGIRRRRGRTGVRPLHPGAGPDLHHEKLTRPFSARSALDICPLLCYNDKAVCRVSSSGRATASQAVGGGFESRILLQKIALQRVVKNMLGRFAFWCTFGGRLVLCRKIWFNRGKQTGIHSEQDKTRWIQ